VGVSIGAIAMLAPEPVHALDGTWTGPGTSWNVGTNWSSSPSTPDNIATFTSNGAPTSLSVAFPGASINTIQFTAGAPAYSISVDGIFGIGGAGIINSSSFAPTLTVNDQLQFGGASTAANAVITNNDMLFFNNSSTAGNAVINNTAGSGLVFQNSSTAGNATITNNGSLIFFNSSTAGNAVVNNGGTLVFQGVSTAGNATITNSSSLQFTQASAAGNATIVTNSGNPGGGLGTLFSNTSTGGNARFITNVGGIVDFSSTAGPAADGKLTAGSIEGAGSYYLGANQLTVGSNNLSTTASGAISDCGVPGLACQNSGATGGALVKVGSGMLTLTGASTYTGPTNINGGILNVSGSLISTVFVNSGAMLMGDGRVGGLVVASGGTAAPGNSVGTLNVAGNVSFAPGSIYQVEVNAAGQSDKIIAGGTAGLAGGTVQVLAQNGTYIPNTRYTILTASGGVSGAFANLNGNFGSFTFLTPALSYDANNAFLTLNRNSIPLVSVARGPNQGGVAAALDTSPLTSTLVAAVLNQSAAGALQAFDALSGEIHASVQTTILDDSRYLRQAVLGRLRQAPSGGDAGAAATLGAGGPMVVTYADPGLLAADPVFAYADAKRSAFPIKAPPLAAPTQTPDLTFWAQGVGAWGKIDGDGNAADVGRNLGGFFTGVDRRFGDWRAGLAGGYTNSSVSVSARASSANIDTAYLAAYAGTSFSQWNFRSGAAFAWHTIASSRSIVFPGFVEQATAHYGAGETQVFGEVGYGMAFGPIAAEPFAGLAWVHLDTRSFTEAGGVSALAGSGNNDDIGYSTLGARVATYYLLQNGMALIPRASVAWQHAFGSVTPVAALAFQSTGAPFGVAGVPLVRDAALVEAASDLRFTPHATIGLSYAGQLADRAHDHSVKGNFTWRF
jgi:outer membrane autotransporter protein